MKDVLKVEIQAICTVHILVIIMAIVFVMIFYIKAKKDHALKAFIVMQISMIGWMIFKIFKTVSPTVSLRWGFIVAYYICACVFEVAFLEFGYAYYKDKPLPRKIRGFIYIVPVAQIIAVATNPWHHLFYKTYTFWGDSFGPLFYAHTLIEYIFVAIGFVYCYKQFQIRFQNKRVWYKYLVSSAILLPLILNFLFITKVIHRWVFAIGIPVVFDITPIVFTWSVLIFVYATFKADFLSLSPLLQQDIVHKLDTAIGVLDANFKVFYVNEKMDDLFKGRGIAMVKRIMKDWKKNETLRDGIKLDGYYLRVHLNKVNIRFAQQYIVAVEDITPYKEVEIELSKRQKDLDDSNLKLNQAIETLKATSKIGARNYVARELHDIIGHSLVVTIKLLEVARLYFKVDKNLSMSAVADASISLEEGIKRMNAVKSIEERPRIYTGERLENDLAKMLVHVKKIGLTTKLHVKGVHYGIDEDVFEVILKTCTELTTNAIKHSGCKEIFISVNVRKEDIYVMVMDNGFGTDCLVKGNGLKGLEERVEAIGGRVVFNTSKGEGFMAKINTPR